MARAIVFRTPGIIPLESFTTFGVNVKPNTTSPFGYFGTGLKYAIAVLLRTSHKIVLWREGKRFEFYIAKEDFRGKEFAFVRMKRQNSLLSRVSYSKLPFTTELGKNWELWQAFRELETNTRDEKGFTSLIDIDVNHFTAHDLRSTYIYVYGDKFIDEYLDMDRHFLVGGKTIREDIDVQVIDRPSKHVYYRGVRIMDLKEEAEFSYNILRSIDLTEDRTAKYPFIVETIIAERWLKSEDESQLQRVTHGRRWESRGLGYTYASRTPSETFRRVATSSSNPTVRDYLVQRDPSVATKTLVQLEIFKPEVTENELADIAMIIAQQLDLNHVRATNMTTDDVWDYSEKEEVNEFSS